MTSSSSCRKSKRQRSVTSKTTSQAAGEEGKWASALALVAVPALLYGRNLQDYFLGDDFELIRSFYGKPFRYLLKLLVYNESGDIWKHLGLDPALGGYLRPLKIWSLALDFELWGTDTLGFHVTSTLLFAFAAVMVFLLARELTGSDGRDGALFAALIAAVHPVFAEIVPWISGREEVIAGAMTLGTVYAFARYRARGTGLAAVCVWLALALLTKESGVVALLLVGGYELSMLTVDRRRRPRDYIRPAVSIGVVVGAYITLRIIAFGSPVGGFGGTHYGSLSALVDHQRAFWHMVFHPNLFSFGSIPGAWLVVLLLGCLALWRIWRARDLLGRRYFANLLFVGPVWYLINSGFYHGVYFSVRHCVVMILGLSLFSGLLVHGALVGLRAGWWRDVLTVALALLAGVAFVPPGQQMSRRFSEAAQTVERVLDQVDRETTGLVPPCTVKLVNAPVREMPPYFFGWGLQSALRLPFRESRIGERCLVLSEEDLVINGYEVPKLARYDRIVVAR